MRVILFTPGNGIEQKRQGILNWIQFFKAQISDHDFNINQDHS